MITKTANILFTLLIITAVGTSDEPVEVWKIIGSGDSEVSSYLQNPDRRTTIEYTKTSLRVSGLCNDCSTEQLDDSFAGFRCTEMWCGSTASKAESYVIDVLTKDNLSFLRRELQTPTNNYFKVQGGEGKYIKLIHDQLMIEPAPSRSGNNRAYLVSAISAYLAVFVLMLHI